MDVQHFRVRPSLAMLHWPTKGKFRKLAWNSLWASGPFLLFSHANQSFREQSVKPASLWSDHVHVYNYEYVLLPFFHLLLTPCQCILMWQSLSSLWHVQTGWPLYHHTNMSVSRIHDVIRSEISTALICRFRDPLRWKPEKLKMKTESNGKHTNPLKTNLIMNCTE